MSIGISKLFRNLQYWRTISVSLFIICMIAPLAACAEYPDPALASHLQKVSNAVNSAVVLKDAPESLSENELLDFATL